jgi:hypothetical protein
MTEKWIQQAHIKSGALHKQLGYSRDALLPEGLLHEIGSANIGTHVRGHTVTPLLKRRVNFALNVRK